ncbi:MAG: hypothetical protein IKT04_03880 [Clostridia bacterium]|nr:hypothetical protein [Clostridia bacterium]MBR6479622.1 hypothetical protein [Clostridia bacterium]MBR6511934.1 hypothetical protein [Clostridia bacterium]
MKLGTLAKIGALAVAAGSTAVGTIMVTTKALSKGDKKPEKAPVSAAPAPKPQETKVEEPKAESNPFYAAAPVIEQAPEPEPIAVPEPVVAAPEPVVAFEPAPEPVPVPVVETPEPEPMPVFTAPEPEPVSFATAPVEPVVEPVEVELPSIEAPAPAAEPVADTGYADLGYQLPYMAGSNNEEGVVIGGAVAEPEPVAVPEPEPIAIPEPEPIAIPEPEPIAVPEPEPIAVPEPEPIAVPEPETVAIPEPEPIAIPEPEPIAIPEPEPIAVPEPEVEAPAAPEVVISTAEPIALDISEEPVLPTAPEEETVKEEINPLAQGFTVSMTDETPADSVLIPQAPTVVLEEPAAEPEPAAIPEPEPIAAPEPTTFEDISSVSADYIEEVEPAPEVSAKGKEIKIGETLVSDKPSNPNIAAVTARYPSIPADSLVSIEAAGGMPMVFEFMYSDMRNDSTLAGVYFISGGEVTLPPETEKENILAYGRNFIASNEELKAFLAE